MPKLLLKFNSALIKEIPLSDKPVGVGRKDDNEVVIDNPAVSGHHCRFGLENGAYYVEDLNSTNGTFVNDQKITKATLNHNDIVTVAKHNLVFFDESKQAAVGSDKTVVMSAPKPAPSLFAANQTSVGAKIGVIRILKGLAGEPEYELKGMSTYIGNSDRVQIPVKNKGLFSKAPEVAAAIYRKTEGYVIVPVEQGHTTVNGRPLLGQEILKEGDLIDCGATTMQFFVRPVQK
jgi:pSer/pThr/pTyr-binding forkhead associated (FHA) protein